LFLWLSKRYAMKTYEGVEVQLHTFLTLTLDGGEWLALRPSHFNPGEEAPGTHRIRGLVDPRPHLDAVCHVREGNHGCCWESY
jgi:hypothetical protein